MDLNAPCPVCAADYSSASPADFIERHGRRFPAQTFAGALDWSPYLMLQLMHRDWLRPLGEADNMSLPSEIRPSSRALVVLLFWTYFETLMNWYYATTTSDLPKSIASDLLRRYGVIGARLDRLHRILFDTTYGHDLETLEYSDIRSHLENLQKRRNAFMHGTPEAINNELVDETVQLLPRFHEAWIHAFNLRCARRPNAPELCR